MARVLIIEDEAVLRSAMARGIAKLPGVTVVEAGTLQAALECLDAQPPGMIISDIDLPDRSGLELLGELGRRRLRVPVLFVSAYLKAYAAQIPPHADVDVREKPVELDELRALVENRLAAGAQEDEAPFGPADYLQLACLGHRSVVIDVESEQAKGAIVVHQGTLWAAHDAQGTGEGAFRRLAFLPGAAVRARVLKEPPGARTIHEGWEQLLIDTARRKDEEIHSQREISIEEIDLDPDFSSDLDVAPPAPPLPRAPAQTLPSIADPPDGVAPTDGFDAAFEAGVEALLGRDHARAYEAFTLADVLRPGDSTVVANLERLRQLGHGRSTP
jgi:DNA-binding response OmpR family regulator